VREHQAYGRGESGKHCERQHESKQNDHLHVTTKYKKNCSNWASLQIENGQIILVIFLSHDNQIATNANLF
jgi:hypothetical protein